jgi:23S rRNA (uracil1939-C5)-methyltransferase
MKSRRQRPSVSRPAVSRPAATDRAERKAAAPGPVRSQLVQIEKAIYGGSFLARVEGKAVFVPLALPGETAKVRVTEEKRGYATAEVEEIVVPAPERVLPACRHFGACGGCQYQHTGYANQLALKQAILRETMERAGLQVPAQFDVLAGSEDEAWGYRNRIRLAFDGHGNPGYRSRRSNAVVPINECPIAASLLVRAAFVFADVARKVAPQLRVEEISLFCDAAETSLLTSVFVKSANRGILDALAAQMCERIPELKGMELAATPGVQGKEQAPRTIARWGQAYLMYRAAGIDYRVDHGAFFQVNRQLVDALVERVTAGGKGALAWDLFAGVGLFARKLASSFERVIAVESAQPAIPGLEANLRGTSGLPVQAWTLDFLRNKGKKQQPDLIIVDPPRTGLGAEIVTALEDTLAPAITYVSCDPATLARDLRGLLASGYAIESLTLADLFPQTFHLETVVQLRRS